jgi:hypothetical protein
MHVTCDVPPLYLCCFPAAGVRVLDRQEVNSPEHSRTLPPLVVTNAHFHHKNTRGGMLSPFAKHTIIQPPQLAFKERSAHYVLNSYEFMHAACRRGQATGRQFLVKLILWENPMCRYACNVLPM